MPWNAESHRTSSTASGRPNSASPLPGSISKLSSRSLIMQKPLRASPNTSFTSLAESNTPPRGPKFGHSGTNSSDRLEGDSTIMSPKTSIERDGLSHAEPCMHVDPAQRRSLFLAEGMQREEVSFDRVGRDRDGYEVYVLRMVESHGFRWNRYLHCLASAEWALAPPLSTSDWESDGYSTDNDEAQGVHELEEDRL